MISLAVTTMSTNCVSLRIMIGWDASKGVSAIFETRGGLDQSFSVSLKKRRFPLFFEAFIFRNFILLNIVRNTEWKKSEKVGYSSIFIRMLCRNGCALRHFSVSVKLNSTQSTSFKLLWEYSRYDSHIYYVESICKLIRYNIPWFSNGNDAFDVYHLEISIYLTKQFS